MQRSKCAVTADYDAQSAVERELVLRLASLLWRLRRATAIESGLFKIQAKHLLQFRQRRQAHQKRQEIIDGVYRNALVTEEAMQQDDDETSSSTLDPGPPSTVEPADPSDDLTRSFVRLSNLPTCPLDRLSRYEATLWRQACQILFTLQCLDRRKPWEKTKVALSPGRSDGAPDITVSIEGTARKARRSARRAQAGQAKPPVRRPEPLASGCMKSLLDFAMPPEPPKPSLNSMTMFTP